MTNKGTILTLVYDVPDAENTEDALTRIGWKPEEHEALLLSTAGTPYSIDESHVMRTIK